MMLFDTIRSVFDSPDTPEEIKPHSSSYRDGSWRNYSIFELWMWTRLLRKRAMHRTDEAKRQKDLYDANNYEEMLQSALESELPKLAVVVGLLTTALAATIVYRAFFL